MASWKAIKDGSEPKTSNNGFFNFKPSEDAGIWTIQYIGDDSSVVSETTYEIKSTDCIVCSCENITFTKNKTPISSNGGEYNFGKVEGSCVNHSDMFNLSVTVSNGAEYLDGDVTINSSNNIIGNVKKNTGEGRTIDITFVFSATDKDGSELFKDCTKMVQYSQQQNECYSSITPPTVTFAGGSTEITLPSKGTDDSRTALVSIGTDDCWRLESYTFISPTPEGYASFIGSGTAIRVSENPTDNFVTTKANYHFINIADPLKTGDSEISIIQKPGCDCNSITNYRVVSSTIDATATTATICEFKLPSTCDDVQFILDSNDDGVVKEITGSSPKIVQDGTSGTYTVTAQTNANTEGEEKSFTYHLSYHDVACDGLTGKTTQGIGCNCGSFTFQITQEDGEDKYGSRFPHEQQTISDYGRLYTDNAAFFNSVSLVNGNTLTVSSGQTITEGNRFYKEISLTLNNCSDNVKDLIKLRIGNRQECLLFTIYRVCPCGTDNCLQELTNTEEPINYPVYVSSKAGYNYYPTGDSVIVGFDDPSTQTPVWLLKDFENETISGNASWTNISELNMITNGEPLDANGNPYVGYQKHFKSDANGNPTECEKTDSDCWLSVFMLSNNILVYIAKNEPGHTQRVINLTYHLPPNTPIIYRKGAPNGWVGYEACTTFITTICQANYGKCWDKIDDSKSIEADCHDDD